QTAVQTDPRNVEYRLAFLAARDRVTRDLLEQAQRAAARNEIPEALRLYQRTLEFDSNNSRAREGIAALEEVSLKRESVGARELEARLRFVFFLASDQLGSSSASPAAMAGATQ
ncbi:MAG TPA: hypothetical protein VEN28_05250, partial [Burkholderiaceae bacterium]|nr:hypothetical protein [Burkholderiaceae bacterium]